MKMSLYNFLLRLFLYVVIVCPVIVFAHAHDKSYVTHGQGHNAHVHIKEPPCSTCPRHGRCVPKVQCPAHVRSGSYNPACHLDGVVGVCCFTGRSHATESEHRSRASTATNIEDVKVSHRQSRLKLEDWVMTAAELLQHSLMTVTNSTSPSFGHHLSVVSHDARAASLGRGGLLNLFAAQEMKARQAISEDDLLLGLTENTDGPFCPPEPTCLAPNRYRSIGGECNNPTSSTWGAVLTGYERLLPPDYSDGTWAIRTSKSGAPLPSARTVSNALVLEGSHPNPTHNLMFMQFGQFIAHDISAGVVFTADNGTAISCCINDGEDLLPPELTHFACAPITIDPDDQFYGQFRRKCINFVRTQIAPAHDCSVGYAKQMNGATHYPDLSHLYGSTEEKLSSLRDVGGLLKVFNDYGRDLPPLTERKECLSTKEGAACFESGDNHGNQIISLTVLHTIFTREHNRLARALSAINPTWDEDKVFWETRRILQAEFQHIIYNEWLPLLLGPQIIKTFALSPSEGYSSSYDPHANPSLSAEFSTAAMRFGHSVVDGRITIPSPKMGGIYETISIQELMFQPTRMRLRHFLDRLLIGLSTQPMQIVDPYVTEGLSRYMFHGGNPYGVDLAAINIQRGRDHGVQSYNQYRKLIGLDIFTDFQQFPPNAAKRLITVYENPDDIDLWVGGLLEEPVEGAIVGPTFANIIADQFARHKHGDRYFYEHGPDVNPGAFTPSQLEEIKKVTLSRLICDNRDGIELVSQPPQAFLRADLPGNEPVPCDSTIIPSMDLSMFRED
ncbi:chorion peroxidase [Spodoptera litura]|uniref:Chorion peroxidase n=1 Tax=Spodoptera litura TaxID=69820 RepID=A0A9J7E8H0_SPOLT|nr:chorion peroxidase [Spodoptera litura]